MIDTSMQKLETEKRNSEHRSARKHAIKTTENYNEKRFAKTKHPVCFGRHFVTLQVQCTTKKRNHTWLSKKQDALMPDLHC